MRRCENHCNGGVSLDNVFVLIEGHPALRYVVRHIYHCN